jgi:hypothetical protein
MGALQCAWPRLGSGALSSSTEPGASRGAHTHDREHRGCHPGWPAAGKSAIGESDLADAAPLTPSDKKKGSMLPAQLQVGGRTAWRLEIRCRRVACDRRALSLADLMKGFQHVGQCAQ